MEKSELEYLLDELYSNKAYGNIYRIFEIFKEKYNIYVNLWHEFYKDGVNTLVSITSYDSNTEDFCKNELCSMTYGDNGEFESDKEAYLFIIGIAIDKIKNYEKEN